MKRSTEDQLVETTAKALATASRTPFKTAFKVTLGIMAAQTVGAVLGLLTLGILVSSFVFVAKHL